MHVLCQPDSIWVKKIDNIKTFRYTLYQHYNPIEEQQTITCEYCTGYLTSLLIILSPFQNFKRIIIFWKCAQSMSTNAICWMLPYRANTPWQAKGCLHKILTIWWREMSLWRKQASYDALILCVVWCCVVCGVGHTWRPQLQHCYVFHKSSTRFDVSTQQWWKSVIAESRFPCYCQAMFVMCLMYFT